MTDMAWGPGPAYRDSACHDFAPSERRAVRRALPQSAICAIALLFSAPIGLAVLYAHPVPATQVAALPSPASHAPLPASVPLRHYAALLDPAMIAGSKPAAFVQPAPLRAAFEPKATALPPEDPTENTADNTSAHTGADLAPAARLPVDEASLEPADTPAEAPVVPALPPMPALVKEVPLPVARPDFAIPATVPHVAARQLASAMPERPAVAVPVAPAPVAPGVAPAAGADENSFFNKLFSPLTKPGSALGYAAVESGAIGVPGTVDRYTAVYDITAHTVTLPNGARLEAHSGLGAYVDNPAGVNLRMRGATPPNLYELTPREAIFHGVRALRMTPTGGTTYGRAGLLTHNYMLRGRVGESNGCVVFANYPAFLAAYESGQVRRLLVVARAS